MASPLAAALARPLEDDWRASIEAIARARKWPTPSEPAQLGALVRALSDAYNAPHAPVGRAVAASAPALAARLGFSFARDVPKSAAAVRELVASGEVAGVAQGRVRVLDVGAGLGATTWGVARALAASGARCTLEATWSDEDGMALDVAVELARARSHREGDVSLKAHPERRRASSDVAGRGPWDLVLLGQVLSELDPALTADERVKRHAELLMGLVGKLAPGGAVVIVEPALRERTRHLHAVRDSVLASRAASVFAPCLHASPCPALATEGDWCHEDVAVDLPEWLAPVARAAGLRWQGLTFSYLVLRRPGERTLAEVLPAPSSANAARLRVISDALVSKGKREHFVCGRLRDDDAASEQGEEPVAVRARVSRLDRDEADANAVFGDLSRGDLIEIDPPPGPKTRVAKGAAVTRLELAAPGLTAPPRPAS